ncbi:sensor histidine kinase [Longivirga aurantiaca]|uniref:histidine kinase n=1 Tax=Longivirga aurantiaca TaxID=1837743 RepID=A0ABW1T4F7_9ACTN
MTLSRRLVIGLVAVTAVTLVVVAAATFLALRSWTVQQLDNALMQPKLAATVDGDRDGRGGNARDLIRAWDINGATVVLLAGGTATPLQGGIPGGAQPEPWSAADAAVLATVPTDLGATPVTVDLEALGDSRAVAVPGTINGTAVTFVAVTPLSRAQGVANRLLLVEVIAVTFAVLLVAFAGTWFVRRELRPLRRVAETASEVASLPLGRGDVVIPGRVEDATSTTEVGQVGLAVNAMLDHVETSLRTRAETEDRLRRFVSDAGHELRTPLASVRGYAELMRRGAATDPEAAAQAAARIEAAASRMGLLVEDLLLLASLDEERPLSQDRLELGPLVADAVAEVSATALDHVWAADVPEELVPVAVIGDASRLHQAVANLLANARAHTPAGTHVTAVVGRDSATAWVEVRDDGPGFPEDLIPRATERFARGDYSRSRATGGSGLGLAIVKAVAEAHGGTLTVGNAAEGSGAVVRLTLPLAPGGTIEVVPPLTDTPATV